MEIANYWSHDLRSQSQHQSQAEGHADALILLALPHEPHVPAVGLANEEVHVEVAEIDLCHQVVAADKGLRSVKAFHLEVLIPDATAGLPEVYATSHLAGAFHGYQKKCRPGAVIDLQ